MKMRCIAGLVAGVAMAASMSLPAFAQYYNPNQPQQGYGYGGPPPGYGRPPPPPPGYGNPPPGYGRPPPPPGYGGPPPGYGRPPPPGYGAQQPGYGNQRPGRQGRGSVCVTSRGSCPTGMMLPQNAPCQCDIPGFGKKRGAVAY